jgi:hypothetical protein
MYMGMKPSLTVSDISVEQIVPILRSCCTSTTWYIACVLCQLAAPGLILNTLNKKELWRIQRNDELEDIIKGENIVRFIKSQRI